MEIKRRDKLLQYLLGFQSINIILFFHLFHIIITGDSTINNIILIGEPTFRYLNFMTFSNEDMIFETTSFPTNNKRIFYGLKKNGRYYFKNNNSEETPFNYLIADIEDEGKLESINHKLMIDNKEYIISIGRLYSYTEIFNFDINHIISKKTEDLFEGINQCNLRPNLIQIDKENNTFIFSSLTKQGNDYYGFIFKFDLEANSNAFSFSNIDKINITKSFAEIASCFYVEEINITICFYGCEENGNKGYCILAYDKDLNETAKKFFTPQGFNDYSFFYSIYFRENAGTFAYYQTESGVSHPVIFFKKLNINKDSFMYYLSENNTIVLDQYTFNSYYILNDIIKINDNKIGFFTTSNSMKVLYIIILNFYNGNNRENIKIRYYSIEIYELLNYKVWKDIKAYMFNDFIILGASYCFIETCNDNGGNLHDYSSALMMIGYPNGSDYELNIINYLKSDGNNTINNLIFDLAENIIIDNNIFGYIYNGTKITNIENSGYIYLISSISNNLIHKNMILAKDEKIKIGFQDNFYNISEYKIEYSYIVTEPEYDKFINYSIYAYPEKDCINEAEIFNSQRKQYIGKTIYYKIILDEDLSINCEDPKCALCLERNKSCITYIQNTYITTETENPKSLILEFQTEKRTEPIIEEKTEIKTEKRAEPIIEDETEIKTEKKTEPIIEDETEIKTEKKTEPIKEDKTEIKTELIDDKTEFNACSQEEIINNECKNGRINDEQIKKIYEILQNETTGNNTNLIIKTENVIFQLLSLEENNDQNYIDDEISSIDLGECLNILKKITNNPLKILKIDYKSEDLTSTFVQYEVYDSTGKKISLSVCSDVSIKIKVPKIL